MFDDDINFSEVANSLDENCEDEVLSGIQDMDRFVALDDWLEMDDLDYRKY